VLSLQAVFTISLIYLVNICGSYLLLLHILDACGVTAVPVTVVIWKKEHISSGKAGHKECQSCVVL